MLDRLIIAAFYGSTALVLAGGLMTALNLIWGIPLPPLIWGVPLP